MAPPERRKSDRKSARMFTEIHALPLDETIGRGVIVDISNSGFAVETEAELKDQAIYELHVEIPLKIRAKVVRKVIPGQMKRFGLKFEEKGFINRLVLRRIIKGNLKSKKV